MKRPNTCVNLIKAINQIDRSGDPVRFSRAMANVSEFCGQGGTAVRMPRRP